VTPFGDLGGAGASPKTEVAKGANPDGPLVPERAREEEAAAADGMVRLSNMSSSSISLIRYVMFRRRSDCRPLEYLY